jgi:hypothetical protein
VEQNITRSSDSFNSHFSWNEKSQNHEQSTLNFFPFLLSKIVFYWFGYGSQLCYFGRATSKEKKLRKKIVRKIWDIGIERERNTASKRWKEWVRNKGKKKIKFRRREIVIFLSKLLFSVSVCGEPELSNLIFKGVALNLSYFH